MQNMAFLLNRSLIIYADNAPNSIIKKNPLKKTNFSTIINNTHYRTENSKEESIKKKKN